MNDRPNGNKLSTPNSLPDYINIEATITTFGYDPQWLKPSSCRIVVTNCAVCGKVRHRKFLCAMTQRKCLECSNAMISRDPKSRAARSKSMKQHYKDGGRHPTKGVGHTPETCAKMSRVRTGMKMNLTPESRRKLADHAMRVFQNPEAKAKMIAINRARKGPLSAAYGRIPGHTRKVWHTRPDGQRVCFRSTWEAAFAKWLDEAGTNWLYEPRTFKVFYVFGGETKHGTYLPDFLVGDKWYEVKGRWTVEGRAKYDAFVEQYPDQPITVADRQWLKVRGIIKR